MQIIDCIQGSSEWLSSRCGVPTASNFNLIITSTGKPSTQKTKYLYRLAGERITGIPEEGYMNANMLRGIELEGEARSLYQIVKDIEVKTVGFCLTDDGWGCSPDGLVGEDGLVQIKCPNMATHIGYLVDNKLPMDYFQQVQGELLITGRKWNDFISYYPGIKPFIFRVERDDIFINSLENELHNFVKELNQIIKKIGD